MLKPKLPRPVRVPNELGHIPIIMYHSVDDSKPFDKNGLNISTKTFKLHIELFLSKGMYPINVRDIRSHQTLSEVPEGFIPIALSFDDGRRSQFCYSANDLISKDCAVAILESTTAQYPTRWRNRASFYVMPKSSYNLEPFQQTGRAAEKLTHLITQGFEVGNHSWRHLSLSNMSSKQVQAEVLNAFYGIKKICPTATLDTFCVPFGAYPHIQDWRKVLLNPLRQQTTMHHVVLMAWGGSSFSPFDTRYDSTRVHRIGVSPGSLLANFQPLEQKNMFYVSGGDASKLFVSRRCLPHLNREKCASIRIVIT